jgi:hypothetical protein
MGVFRVKKEFFSIFLDWSLFLIHGNLVAYFFDSADGFVTNTSNSVSDITNLFTNISNQFPGLRLITLF